MSHSHNSRQRQQRSGSSSRTTHTHTHTAPHHVLSSPRNPHRRRFSQQPPNTSTRPHSFNNTEFLGHLKPSEFEIMNHPLPPLQADNSTNKNKNKEKSPSICSDDDDENDEDVTTSTKSKSRDKRIAQEYGSLFNKIATIISVSELCKILGNKSQIAFNKFKLCDLSVVKYNFNHPINDGLNNPSIIELNKCFKALITVKNKLKKDNSQKAREILQNIAILIAKYKPNDRDLVDISAKQNKKNNNNKNNVTSSRKRPRENHTNRNTNDTNGTNNTNSNNAPPTKKRKTNDNSLKTTHKIDIDPLLSWIKSDCEKRVKQFADIENKKYEENEAKNERKIVEEYETKTKQFNKLKKQNEIAIVELQKEILSLKNELNDNKKMNIEQNKQLKFKLNLEITKLKHENKEILALRSALKKANTNIYKIEDIINEKNKLSDICNSYRRKIAALNENIHKQNKDISVLKGDLNTFKKKGLTLENSYKQKLLELEAENMKLKQKLSKESEAEIKWKEKFHQEENKCMDLQQKMAKYKPPIGQFQELTSFLQTVQMDEMDMNVEDDKIENTVINGVRVENRNENMDVDMDMDMNLDDEKRDKLKLDIETLGEEEEREVMQEINELYEFKEKYEKLEKKWIKLKQQREGNMDDYDKKWEQVKSLTKKNQKLNSVRTKLKNKIMNKNLEIENLKKKIKDDENDGVESSDHEGRDWKCEIVQEFKKNNEKYYEVQWDNSQIKAEHVSDRSLRNWHRKIKKEKEKENGNSNNREDDDESDSDSDGDDEESDLSEENEMNEK